MRLTPELAAWPGRAGAAAPPDLPEGRWAAGDADHAAAVEAALGGAPAGAAVWVFAYGSLIWSPPFEVAERRRARAAGWHRDFCLGWDTWFRGSAAHPGLMLGLDRGGACVGVACRLAPGTEAAGLLALMQREIRLMPPVYCARWMPLVTPEGPLRALGFVMDRSSASYVGRLPRAVVADALARAAGPMGTMAEYLRSTVERLEAMGIRDDRLWRLQEMVAERIAGDVADG